mmetsp:Transcript_16766/g.24289  ORF Transcript_16766/g.24289 Transcript_16766/m.24289 type:complete len:149 (-) Transcript_16766:73-519(-)
MAFVSNLHFIFICLVVSVAFISVVSGGATNLRNGYINESKSMTDRNVMKDVHRSIRLPTTTEEIASYSRKLQQQQDNDSTGTTEDDTDGIEILGIRIDGNQTVFDTSGAALNTGIIVVIAIAVIVILGCCCAFFCCASLLSSILCCCC